MTTGNLFIISAPSGTGKSFLLKLLLKNNKLKFNIKLSISYTTRIKRIGEINNKDYFFISKKKFQKMIINNEFLEYAKVFGNYYGTPKKNIKNILKDNTDIFLNIDWQGAKQVRKKISQVCSIFILPPSIKELYRRLNLRGKDHIDIINKRMLQSKKEIYHFYEYDYLIINNNINDAIFDLKNIIYAEHLKIKKQFNIYNIFINKLLNE
ncbi:guanylate kinase [Enterobacteriaceae endosymbiont of Plateumaris consimilis]|uniref:guanylate kinase n=1 Tax=Enterobacteriaceae endosymbiont of Plateumaris consimilis TaxID=2675794 RepID=UPI001448FDEA|nr:guanylate kinase [Enterobacteriaceae endosymbiont of Plateumaris consimilis]QJC28835.1 guanylate kinase [Enterobacteriaceae endosymbiont of Plateumaris consimilis]